MIAPAEAGKSPPEAPQVYTLNPRGFATKGKDLYIRKNVVKLFHITDKFLDLSNKIAKNVKFV